MAAVSLAPDWAQHFHDDNGYPATGWKVYVYESNSTDYRKSYSNSEGTSGTIPNSHPIILDARGECDLKLSPEITYKIVVYDRAGNLIYTEPTVNGVLTGGDLISVVSLQNAYDVGNVIELNPDFDPVKVIKEGATELQYNDIYDDHIQIRNEGMMAETAVSTSRVTHSDYATGVTNGSWQLKYLKEDGHGDEVRVEDTDTNNRADRSDITAVDYISKYDSIYIAGVLAARNAINVADTYISDDKYVDSGDDRVTKETFIVPTEYTEEVMATDGINTSDISETLTPTSYNENINVGDATVITDINGTDARTTMANSDGVVVDLTTANQAKLDLGVIANNGAIGSTEKFIYDTGALYTGYHHILNTLDFSAGQNYVYTSVNTDPIYITASNWQDGFEYTLILDFTDGVPAGIFWDNTQFRALEIPTTFDAQRYLFHIRANVRDLPLLFWCDNYIGVYDVTAGDNVSIDDSNPANPIISVPSIGVETITAGDGISVDNTDPTAPIITNTIPSLTLDPTGFTSPESTIVTYNIATRTVTVTGAEVEAYYHGELIPSMVSGWTSDPHPLSPTSTLFLYYNGSAYVWTTSLWAFSEVMICSVVYTSSGAFVAALRETHGLMPWQAHKEFHSVVGTYKDVNTGILSSYVLASTIAGDRRPVVSECVLNDEDLQTTNAILSNDLYTRFNLSGVQTANITNDTTDIVPLSGNRPYYNQWNGSAWVQTLMSNNSYMNVWVLAIPATADSESQKRRFVFVQGQTEFSNATNARNEDISSVNFGEITGSIPEVVAITQIIVQYTSSNWRINEVRDLIGTKISQSSVAGGFDYSKLPLIPQTTPPTPMAEGTIYSDANKHNLVAQTDTDAAMDIGREQWFRAYNGTGVTITNGSPVYMLSGGIEGTVTVSSIALAKADAKTTCTFVGVATEDILNNDYGEVTIGGKVNDLNLSAYSIGDVLYISATTAGTYTTTPPTSPNYESRIGKVLSNDGTTGVLYVYPTTDPISSGGSSSDELVKVNASGVAGYLEDKLDVASGSPLSMSVVGDTLVLDITDSTISDPLIKTTDLMNSNGTLSYTGSCWSSVEADGAWDTGTSQNTSDSYYKVTTIGRGTVSKVKFYVSQLNAEDAFYGAGNFGAIRIGLFTVGGVCKGMTDWVRGISTTGTHTLDLTPCGGQDLTIDRNTEYWLGIVARGIVLLSLNKTGSGFNLTDLRYAVQIRSSSNGADWSAFTTSGTGFVQDSVSVFSMSST